MRVKDFLTNKPLVSLDYLVLDIDSFICKSKFTNDLLIPKHAEKCLTLLSASYNYISVKAPTETSVISKIFTKYNPADHIGKLVTAPYKEWPELLTEYGTLLLYYGNPSNPEIVMYVPENRRLRFSSDPRIMDTLITNFRARNTTKEAGADRRAALEKVKRSSARDRITSEVRTNSFVKKFEDFRKES